MAESRLRKIRVAGVALAAALAGLAVPLAAGSATAATVNPGTLKVAPASVTAGSTGNAFTFTYTAAAKGTAGTVAITVPAGFSAPQGTSAGGAGYLSASSDCAQFGVTSIAPGAGGTFTTTVTNNGPATSAGVSVAVAAPADLLSPSATTATGSYAGGTWTVGSLASGASATLTITGLAGNVADGTQTATATATATTADPNATNNSASASEASQPAPVGLSIIPDPNNPGVIDTSLPGTVTWTASVTNSANPAAPPPACTITWSCSTVSLNACPAPLGSFNSPSITFQENTLGVDTYTLNVLFTWTDPNFQPGPGLGTAQTSVMFTTTNSGG